MCRRVVPLDAQVMVSIRVCAKPAVTADVTSARPSSSPRRAGSTENAAKPSYGTLRLECQAGERSAGRTTSQRSRGHSAPASPRTCQGCPCPTRSSAASTPPGCRFLTEFSSLNPARRKRRQVVRPGWRASDAFLDRCAQAGTEVSAIAEMSKSSLIFSLTSTPPVSSAALKLRPQSERLIVTPPSKPTRRLP